MKDALIDERMANHIEHTRKMIAAQGYAVQSVQAQPSFTYTAGMSNTAFGADILIPGSSMNSIQWIHRFSQMAVAGVIEAVEGKNYSAQFGGVAVHLRRLLPRQVNKLMRMATILAEPIQVRGFLLIVPLANMEHHEIIMQEKFLHDPVLDERNLR
jgi:hypothetical protein